MSSSLTKQEWESRVQEMLKALQDHILAKKARGEETNAPIRFNEFDVDDEFVVSEFDIYGARYVEDELPAKKRGVEF